MQKKKNNIRLRYLVAFIIAIIAMVYVSKRDKYVPYIRTSGIVWTTQYNITYQSDKCFDDSIQNIFNKIDSSVSMFNKSSLISRINRGENVETDLLIKCLYDASLKINNETKGAFDPTVTPLMKVWGFVDKGGVIPDTSTIDSIMNFIGINKTQLDKGGFIVKDDSRISFDFSAIAKGLACDEIGQMLYRNGVENYLVEIGGEISLNGVNNAGEKWHISIDKPIESNTEVLHDNVLVVGMNSGGIATSGNYRNYKEIDGRKVVHTMNPLTGYPEESDLLSATIIAENCMLADGYATACMVMGLERSKEFLQSRNDIAGLLIYGTSGDTIATWSNSTFNELLK